MPKFVIGQGRLDLLGGHNHRFRLSPQMENHANTWLSAQTSPNASWLKPRLAAQAEELSRQARN